ncbi:MAG TPA: Xaa-Pro aminopeptidase [Candidatus Saccharimonadales bacterium]|nr:Xaa-Pro aminopeptidase [Candidatus Saccharimonadales bacterium]
MDAAFFSANRRRLLEKLEPGSFVAVAGNGSMQRSSDEAYAFEQDPDFWYLTGIEEPDWQLFIDVDSREEWLVAPHLNRYHTAFHSGMTPDTATKRTGVGTVLGTKEGKALLQKLLGQKKRGYTVVPPSTRVYGFQTNPGPRKLIAQLKGVERTDMRLTLAKLRAIKQPVEIEAIQAAVDVTVDGLLTLIRELKTYRTENEADARLYYEFRRRGGRHGFDPIVASGRKTCILHSAPANDPLDDWLLLDVGARVNGYTADITRTIPLHPPTGRQVQVYEAVQRMHDHFESVVKPGAPVRDVLMKDAYLYVGEEMVKLGLLKKPLLDHDHVFKFMPHGITHGLGIDVHDPLGRPEFFAEGMVLTNEVGVYIPEEGFGVRIENDMVITADGVRNMAAKLPFDLDTLASMVY